MAQLTIRKLDDDLVRRLKIRAAQNGRSAEAEVRAILERSLGSEVAEIVEKSRRLRKALSSTYAGNSTELLRAQRREGSRRSTG